MENIYDGRAEWDETLSAMHSLPEDFPRGAGRAEVSLEGCEGSGVFMRTDSEGSGLFMREESSLASLEGSGLFMREESFIALEGSGVFMREESSIALEGSGVFMRTDASTVNVPQERSKRLRLEDEYPETSETDDASDVDMCSIMTSETERCELQQLQQTFEKERCELRLFKHVRFSPQPPAEFPTFTCDEYDRSSIECAALDLAMTNKGTRNYYALLHMKQRGGMFDI